MNNVDSESNWRRPVADPDRWCYPCFTAHLPEVTVDPAICAAVSRPRDTDWVLSGALFGALDALGIPSLSEGWHPAHIATVRNLVGEFQWRIEFAEQQFVAPSD